ncbi:unnamed protein product [Gordionus sp. m RMFG-2023]
MDIIKYRCRVADCHAKCLFDGAYIASGIHDHPFEIGTFEMLKTKVALENIVAQNHLETRLNIYQLTMDKRCDTIIYIFEESHRQTPYEISVPYASTILDIELSAEYAMTTRNERFLIHGIGNLYVFGTDSMLRLTEGSEMIYMDGTFHVAPTLFYQLYTLHVMYEGCFSHYSQALWRRCQSLGLVSLYLNHSNVHKVVRRMTTLPFCKEEDVSRVRQNCYIMASENPMLMGFMEYIDTTWLGLNAIFPHGIWTRYKVDGPSTNNQLEGFHHALKRKTAHAHPNVYILIINILTTSKLSRSIMDLEGGEEIENMKE